MTLLMCRQYSALRCRPPSTTLMRLQSRARLPQPTSTSPIPTIPLTVELSKLLPGDRGGSTSTSTNVAPLSSDRATREPSHRSVANQIVLPTALKVPRSADALMSPIGDSCHTLGWSMRGLSPGVAPASAVDSTVDATVDATTASEVRPIGSVVVVVPLTLASVPSVRPPQAAARSTIATSTATRRTCLCRPLRCAPTADRCAMSSPSSRSYLTSVPCPLHPVTVRGGLPQDRMLARIVDSPTEQLCQTARPDAVTTLCMRRVKRGASVVLPRQDHPRVVAATWRSTGTWQR